MNDRCGPQNMNLKLGSGGDDRQLGESGDSQRKLPDRDWTRPNAQAMVLSLFCYPPLPQAFRPSHSGGHVCVVRYRAPVGPTLR